MRKIIVTLLTILTIFSICLPAYAAEVEVPETSETESIVEPRADVIVIKYRTYNGKYQYRRWNETQGYWVDPYWIDMQA